MKKTLLVAMIFSAGSAYAADSSFYFKPKAGNNVVELSYLSGSTTGDTEITPDTKKTEGTIELKYVYGLADDMALGFYTGSGDIKTGNAKQSGMTDLHAFFKGASDIINYGIDLGISPGKAEENKRYTGGLSLKANVGVLLSADAFNYGLDLGYLMPFERSQKNTTGADTKITGGSKLSVTAFGEYNYGAGYAGLKLASNQTAEAKTKVGDVDGNPIKGKNTTAAALYASYVFNESVTGLVELGTEMYPEKDGTKAYSNNTIEVGARFTF